MSRPRPPTRPPNGEEGIRTTLYFTKAQHRALRIEAAERGMTMTAILVEALQARHYLVNFTQRAVGRDPQAPG